MNWNFLDTKCSVFSENLVDTLSRNSCWIKSTEEKKAERGLSAWPGSQGWLVDELRSSALICIAMLLRSHLLMDLQMKN